MELTYRQVEAALIGYMRIKPDRVGTFRSRIKQLQRLSFPEGVNIGRGAKMAYTVEHLCKLTVAFELISMGWSAQFVTELVEDQWQAIASGLSLSHLIEYKGSNESVYLDFRIHALHDMQHTKYGNVPRWVVTVMDGAAVANKLKPKNDYGDAGTYLLQVQKLFKRLEAACEYSGFRLGWYDEMLGWLPTGEAKYLNFADPYPDRSNMQARRNVQFINGNDPEASTPEGEEEGKDFFARYLDPKGPPF